MDTVNTFIATADFAALDELQSLIAARRAALIAGRNAGLSEYPVLCPAGQPGHKIQVTREQAVALLDAGTHELSV